jgi:hypothetical protein
MSLFPLEDKAKPCEPFLVECIDSVGAYSVFKGEIYTIYGTRNALSGNLYYYIDKSLIGGLFAERFKKIDVTPFSTGHQSITVCEEVFP